MRAHDLTALIEAIDRAPNEQQAKQAEQAWIDHHIRLGCPLTNSEAGNDQRVLDVQSGRIPSREERRNLYCPAHQYRSELASAKALQITRWRNRAHCAYFLDTTYNSHLPFVIYHDARKAQEYNRTIFEHTLPAGKTERYTALREATIAYLYWNEHQTIWQKTRKYDTVGKPSILA
ncbi:MAG: hypothetical protein J2P36_14755 [Ktedonobacteraceae bacterium]|nr:hypothetical protein [Ktedonobacteraceae bacterium]